GHFHPKLRLRVRGRSVSRRCFIATAHKLILPAFGALTGGLDAAHPEIVRAVGPGAEALIPVEDRLLRFPLAAGLRACRLSSPVAESPRGTPRPSVCRRLRYRG
ncbi:hypothetical protein JND45_15110, partial [Listeria monocytogenes]|nr:hypothetical protein [Listeria monocytogenes]